MSDQAIRTAVYALIVMGVAGSGKTTVAQALAKRIGWAFKDGDGFHPRANVEKMRSGHPLTDDDRWPWLRAIAAEIERATAAGQRIVIACSALKRAYRDVLIGERTGVRMIYLRGTRDVVLHRLQARQGHFMPPHLLDSQFATLEEPGADERAIVVDINAPLATMIENIMVELSQQASD